MKNYYLAVDIGASSGRHILGCVQNGKIITEEIYRFKNGVKQENGTLVWDTDYLTREVIAGIAKCKEIGKLPKTVAIDTWGVDYVLLDENGKELLPAVSYRDSRTNDVISEVSSLITPKELYQKTGIQKQNFNTIYQLFCDKKAGKLEKAKHFLMMPDYLSYKLTGVMKNEYTNATTTNLVNAETRTWDFEILAKLGFSKEIFCELSAPQMVIGNFTDEIAQKVGFQAQVIYCPSHDTASAVAACPGGENTVYISSGTWSLMGVENDSPNCSEESRLHNFTNEGGYGGKYRYLKNIMGLWMMQSVKKELLENCGEDWSFDDLCRMAKLDSIESVVDCNNTRFLSPPNMMAEIQNHCAQNNQQVPKTAPQFASVIYRSLAFCYAKTKAEIEEITGKQFKSVHIVGGGAKDGYLNDLTAKACGCTVYAGPTEATAIGNLLSQMRADGVFPNIKSARACVFQSFGCQEYKAR
ncbi:MAG: rhamnulokinase family protein [Candidatus Fimenecus sp.]